MNKHNVRTVSLIVCTFTYLLAGAAIFDALESEEEKESLRHWTTQKLHIMKRHGITDSDWDQFRWLVRQLRAHNAIQWKFGGSFYYATTVLTTIGYGHSTPRTDAGKIFTMLYALVGCPLNLVMIQSIGERFNTMFIFILKNIKKLFRMKSTEVSTTNMIGVCSTLCLLTVLSGAYVFNHFEKWGYLNCIYFCVTTLTTVGFGDYVAMQNQERDPDAPGLEDKVEYVAFTFAFILIGLAVISANMNLMVLRFMITQTEDDVMDHLVNATEEKDALIAASNTKVKFDQSTTESSTGSSCQNDEDRRSSADSGRGMTSSESTSTSKSTTSTRSSKSSRLSKSKQSKLAITVS